MTLNTEGLFVMVNIGDHFTGFFLRSSYSLAISHNHIKKLKELTFNIINQN